MRKIVRVTAAAVVTVVALAFAEGWILGAGALHPQKVPLWPELIAKADEVFSSNGAARSNFEVTAPDAVLLRGWKVRPTAPNGDWVLLFHGVADNRLGTLSYTSFLLQRGYSLIMMDARAQGVSDGNMATFGWRERNDTRAIVDQLMKDERPHCLFALGESMGAAIALQSAAVEPRIEGVVAESAFRDMREVTYDYAGLHWSPLLGKTLFRSASIAAIRRAENEGGFRADDISPERAVQTRPFPVLLICDDRDTIIPCRHTEAIYAAAIGPKSMWKVEGAGHTGAFGAAPAEFERRVIGFFSGIHAEKQK